MSRKIFAVLLAALFLAANSYAAVLTDQGLKEYDVCYMKGCGAVVSGAVVVLTDDSNSTRTVEFPGREVTNTETEGEKIYGVVAEGINYSIADMEAGQWVRIQVRGYCETIIVDEKSGERQVTNGYGLYTSDTAFQAVVGGSGLVTGGVVAFTTTVGTGLVTTDGYINP